MMRYLRERSKSKRYRNEKTALGKLWLPLLDYTGTRIFRALQGRLPYYYIQMDDARKYMYNLAHFGHHQVLVFGNYLDMLKSVAEVMYFNILEGK